MVFIWVDQGIRDLYVPQFHHLPVKSSAPIHESESGRGVEIHEETENLASYEYQKALESYKKTLKEEETFRKKIIYAKDIMSADVIVLGLEDSIAEAEILFKEKRFRHIPVIKEGMLVGIVSDRDLLRIKVEYPGTYQSLKIAEIMRKKILTAYPETEIRDIAHVMLEEKIGSMIILDHKAEIAGIITRTDILRSIVNHAPLELWG